MYKIKNPFYAKKEVTLNRVISYMYVYRGGNFRHIRYIINPHEPPISFLHNKSHSRGLRGYGNNEKTFRVILKNERH